jgi:hypothetical protein
MRSLLPFSSQIAWRNMSASVAEPNPTGFPAFVVCRKPALGRDNQYARRFVRAVFAPLRPPFVRTSGVVVKIELVQRDGNRRSPQQFAQLEDGPGVLVAFVSVA